MASPSSSMTAGARAIRAASLMTRNMIRGVGLLRTIRNPNEMDAVGGGTGLLGKPSGATDVVANYLRAYYEAMMNEERENLDENGEILSEEYRRPLVRRATMLTPKVGKKDKDGTGHLFLLEEWDTKDDYELDLESSLELDAKIGRVIRYVERQDASRSHPGSAKKRTHKNKHSKHHTSNLVTKTKTVPESALELPPSMISESASSSRSTLMTTREYFPEVWHICRPRDYPEAQEFSAVSLMVRQKAISPSHALRLVNVRRDAFERQMILESGCTGCIILGGSRHDPSELRVIELWKSMRDFHHHTTSEWHAEGEHTILPFVRDMDSLFCLGVQLRQQVSK